MSLLQKKTVGIDFHDYSAQLIELELIEGKLNLQSYSRVIIPPNVIEDGEILKPDEVTQLLTKLFQDANPAPVMTKDIVVVFPPTQVFSHIFTFPINLDEDEIRRAIPFEAETVIPYALQDMYWDFTVLDKTSSDTKMQSVLFAAIVKKTADSYRKLLEAMGMNPYFFGVEAESLKYALAQQIETSKNSLIIDINTLSTNYLLLKNGVIIDFFSSNEGGRYLVESLSEKGDRPPQQVLEGLANELVSQESLEKVKSFLQEKYKVADKILSSNEKKDSTLKVNDIFLIGEFLNLPQYLETARECFPKRRIQMGDPRSNLVIVPENFVVPGKEKDIAEQYYIYFVHAIGVASKALLSDSRKGINLLPDNLKKSFIDKKRKMIAAIISLFFTVFSLLFATFIFYKYTTFYYTRHNLEIQVASVTKIIYGTRYQEIRDAINKFNNEVSELAAIDASMFSLPTVLKTMREVMPTGITLNGLTYVDNLLLVEITGIADTRETLLKAHSELAKLDFVDSVTTPSSSYDERFNTSFLIKVTLKFKNLPRYASGINAN